MRNAVFFIWLGATMFWSAACHTLKPATLRQVDVGKPGQVWVTRSDQSKVVIDGPQVFGDTLVGYVDGVFSEIPGSDVQALLMKRPAKARTAALILGTTVTVAAFAALVSNTNSYQDPAHLLDCDDDPDQPGCPGAM